MVFQAPLLSLLVHRPAVRVVMLMYMVDPPAAGMFFCVHVLTLFSLYNTHACSANAGNIGVIAGSGGGGGHVTIAAGDASSGQAGGVKIVSGNSTVGPTAATGTGKRTHVREYDMKYECPNLRC